MKISCLTIIRPTTIHTQYHSHTGNCELSKLQIIEEALIYESPNYNKMQIRSQQRIRIHQEILSQEDEDEIKEVKDKNDPPDKGDIKENASTDDEDKGSGNHKNNNNQGLRIKITNIINSRDLLFLRRNNVSSRFAEIF